MTAQLPLFGEQPKPTRADRPTLRRRDLEGAQRIRTNYGVFDVLRVNSDKTVTCRANPMAVPHVIPFEDVQGVAL